jgi:hypothetical protein
LIVAVAAIASHFYQFFSFLGAHRIAVFPTADLRVFPAARRWACC